MKILLILKLLLLILRVTPYILLILKLRLHILKLHPAHFHPPTRFPMKWGKIENRAKIMTQKTAET